jgi:RNA polymerase sigma-70 factor (ECF subfamily)
MEAAALHEAGRTAWPGVDVPLQELAAYAAAREPVAEHAASLYLACACARGDERAVAALVAAYFGPLRAVVTRILHDAAPADEAMQSLREKLFVKDPTKNKERGIAGYSGRGDLRGWLRVAASRVALGMLRARRAADSDSDGETALQRIAAGDPDPELALLRSRYAPIANEALREVFAGLATRERNLLRQHFVDGLGIDALGGLYGVHRATAARWLERARETLEVRTRKLLIERLGVNGNAVESLVRLLQSELHLTLSGDDGDVAGAG